MLCSDYGHWETLQEVDINDYLGFVYVITFDNGKKYIGAKKLWKNIKHAPKQFKSARKRQSCVESDWRNYTSSSKEVNSMISSNIKPLQFLIVGWYETWGKTLYAEAMMQIENNVLGDSTWLNKQIGGHFNPNCFDELTEEDIARYLAYNVGNEHTHYPVMYKIGHKTKYVHPDKVQTYLDNGWSFGRNTHEQQCTIITVVSVNLYNIKTEEEVVVENCKVFCAENNLAPGHVSRLIHGDLDTLEETWELPPSVSRRRYVVQGPDGKKFTKINECDSYYGFRRGATGYRLRNPDMEASRGFVKLTPETRSEYKARLKENPVAKTKRIVSGERVLRNSFNAVTTELLPEFGNDISSIAAWVRKLVKYHEKPTGTNTPYHPDFPEEADRQFTSLDIDNKRQVMDSWGFVYDQTDDEDSLRVKFNIQLDEKMGEPYIPSPIEQQTNVTECTTDPASQIIEMFSRMSKEGMIETMVEYGFEYKESDTKKELTNKFKKQFRKAIK